MPRLWARQLFAAFSLIRAKIRPICLKCQPLSPFLSAYFPRWSVSVSVSFPAHKVQSGNLKLYPHKLQAVILGLTFCTVHTVRRVSLAVWLTVHTVPTGCHCSVWHIVLQLTGCPSQSGVLFTVCRVSFLVLRTVSVSPGIEPGYIIFPSHK
jgi:hypothetical protein